jgi:large subunit ribosomal protein L23
MKQASAIIRSIQITEKGTTQAEKGKYFFKVEPSANKMEIKRAVEEMFKVPVAKVNTMNCLGKLKRERTARYGRKSDWKRAIVTLKEGSRIELA